MTNRRFLLGSTLMRDLKVRNIKIIKRHHNTNLVTIKFVIIREHKPRMGSPKLLKKSNSKINF